MVGVVNYADTMNLFILCFEKKIMIFIFTCCSARERIVGWYHTGPKLHKNDIAINELMKQYCSNSVSVFRQAVSNSIPSTKCIPTLKNIDC